MAHPMFGDVVERLSRPALSGTYPKTVGAREVGLCAITNVVPAAPGTVTIDGGSPLELSVSAPPGIPMGMFGDSFRHKKNRLPGYGATDPHAIAGVSGFAPLLYFCQRLGGPVNGRQALFAEVKVFVAAANVSDMMRAHFCIAVVANPFCDVYT